MYILSKKSKEKFKKLEASREKDESKEIVILLAYRLVGFTVRKMLRY